MQSFEIYLVDKLRESHMHPYIIIENKILINKNLIKKYKLPVVLEQSNRIYFPVDNHANSEALYLPQR